MKNSIAFGVLGIASFFSTSGLIAQEITGTWQGMILTGSGIRSVVQIVRGTDGNLKGTFYSIDETSDAYPITSISFENSILNFSVGSLSSVFRGEMLSQGDTIRGEWGDGIVMSPFRLQRATKDTEWKISPSLHTTQSLSVEDGVKLEVLDWGGSGRPIVLLAGLGNTAHIFDLIAPKLAAKYHVYGVTRRGFGSSSTPQTTADNYSSDRLGDDVVAVLDALSLKGPILIGHSIAGEELSSIGAHHPEKVAGLIYLEAGYPYALYDPRHGDLQLDALDAQRNLARVFHGGAIDNPKDAIASLLVTLPQLELELRGELTYLEATPVFSSGEMGAPPDTPGFAVLLGQHKYAKIGAPCLAIFAVPHDTSTLRPITEDEESVVEKRDLEQTTAQVNAFQSLAPSCRTVQLRNASHFIFKSNETDVLREIDGFIGTLR